MVRRRQRERSLFEVLLPDGHKLWPDWLRKIDTLLEDEAVIEVVAQALEARWPQSRRRGRPGHAGGVVIRMLILKHLFDWSYDDLEREVRANLVYRAFTRIDAGEVPDAKTILKIARALGPGGHRAAAPPGGRGREACRGHARPPLSHRHHGRRNECALSDRQHVVAGRRPRADAHDAAGQCGVGRSARTRAQSPAERRSTRADHRAPGAVAGDPRRPGPQLSPADGHDARGRARCHDDGAPDQPAAPHRVAAIDDDVDARRQQLQQMQPLVTRVLEQTRARVLGGDTHVPDKVLSVFEPHTEAIRKGKIAKPTEFGKLVTIQESRASDHHRLRGARPTAGRHDAVDARAGSAHRDVWSAAGPGRGRSRIRLGQERRGGDARAVCDASSCRGRGAKRRRGGRTSGNDGSAAASAGASAAKAASV